MMHVSVRSPPVSLPLSLSLHLSLSLCIPHSVRCVCESATVSVLRSLAIYRSVSALCDNNALEKEGGEGSDNGDGDGNGSDILRRRVAWFEALEVARESKRKVKRGRWGKR